MALIKCPDCKETVSSDAVSCPKCGREIKYWTTGRILIAIIILIFGVGGIQMFCIGYERSRQSDIMIDSSSDTPTRSYSMQTPVPQPTENFSVDDIKSFDRIRAKAERDYPNDYTVQKYTVETEIEAYKYMKTVPESKLKTRVQRDYPNDFTVQKYIYNADMDAKEELDKFKTATNSAMSKIPANSKN